MATKKSTQTVAGSIKIDALASISEFNVLDDWGMFTLEPSLLHLVSGSDETELVLPFDAPFIIVDARDSTVLELGSLSIYQSMTLMYGARFLHSAQKLMTPLTCFALLKGDYKNVSVPFIKSEFKFNTMTERIVVDQNWTTVELQSDLFVVPTSLGYSAALLVTCSDSSEKHLLCGAKSLKEPLERLRSEHGAINGLVVSIRKMSAEKTAPYQVVLGKIGTQ
jgi:hypothetical protein